MSDPGISQQFLKSILVYDPETGLFRWRGGYGSVVAGRIAGRTCGKGYRTISVKNKHRQAHRLAWLYMYGEWPNKQVDHINRDKSDNRISNLRLVSPSENCANRGMPLSASSGLRGISRLRGGKWQVQICTPGQRRPRYIGIFQCLGRARAAYIAARCL